MNTRALIAMSGGVDSSVAAYLMLQQGYECIGCTMKLYENTDAGIPQGHTCCSLSDIEDAAAVARSMGMPHYVFNFTAEFREQVIGKFIRCYQCGRTPNPCIECNRHLKFSHMYRRAMELGCGYIATGHYARVERREDGRWLLKKGLDQEKDQSYVLYMLTQELLSHLKLPLGELTKAQVRAIAEERGLLNARKHDSQDICFVPDGDYEGFIRRYTGAEYPPGDFVDEAGNVLGRHRGMIAYTVGQRRGLGVSGGRKLYVCRKNMEDNTVVLGDNDRLFTSVLRADRVNLIDRDRIEGELRCAAKIRYSHGEAPCVVTQTDDDEIQVVFDEPQRAITAGQAVVLYDGDTVIGGGTIL